MIKSNMDNNSLLWLSYFIKNMHLHNVETSSIYKELADYENEEELKRKLFDLYDKYCLEIKISKNNFVVDLIKIYGIIQKKILSQESISADTIMKKFRMLAERPEKENFEKITYPLFLFTQRLYYQLLRDGARKVFFLSREGQFMKKLFDTFQEHVVGPKIETEYLYVSRASTFVGTLNELEDEDFETLLNQYPNMSLDIFCKNLGFTPDEIQKVSDYMNWNFKLKVESIKGSVQLERLLNNKIFVKIYNSKRVHAKKMFTKYISQFGSDYKDKLFIVDVGWKGTIQNNIQKMLPDTTVIGYYLGLVHYDAIEDYDRKNAVLFENTLLRKTNNCYLYNSNRSIFEMLLAADHGSTSCYEEDTNGIVKPILKDEKMEYELFVSKVHPIQENVYDLFKSLLEILENPCYNTNLVEHIINNKFFDLMFKPSKNEIQEYQGFYHFENFGVMDYSYFSNPKKVTFASKCYHYLNFMKFVRNDDTWQYLKLYNNQMHLGIKILYSYKKYKFKKRNVI